MKIGDYKVETIISGKFALDGGAMFGIVPKAIWSKYHPADPENRIDLVTRNLLLISDKKKILIDAGMGNKWSEKQKKIYKVDDGYKSLEDSLLEKGIHSDEITDVIVTHLHFDHIGGGTKIVEGEIAPTFKNAEYHISEANLIWALSEGVRDKASYLSENIDPIVKSGKLVLYDKSNFAFDSTITFQLFNGHTYGQMLPIISDDKASFFYCGDLIPTAAHLPIRYTMAYDLQPIIAENEKNFLLNQAEEKGWRLIFEHDPNNSGCTVVKHNDNFIAGDLFE